ncbi:MAG TPA: hypothetical protein VFG04_24595 [Planctomycetaceae bacterium]|jgi:hypothetical protein|nr:hypothetical protein [Planctomycetaceae bacterium]
MQSMQRWNLRSSLVVVAFLVAPLLTSSCEPLKVTEGLVQFSEENPANRGDVREAPTVRNLARELDSVERHIEQDGSVVAEQPSVWGQARLTMYREEFETQMLQQLSKFQPTLQASLSRSDQAYAADAMALSFTAQAASTGSPSGGTSKGASSSSSSSSSAGGSGPSSAPASSGDQFTGTFAAFNNVSRTPVLMPNPLGFGVTGQNGLSLEPTVYIDQMKRYIDHLQELRRMNDGDDTADAPGYSLNLVRIPVSVLPGRHTQERYGAEITFTLTPHLHDELLPMTFRNLVVNDLLDEIAVPMTQLLNDWDVRSVLYEAVHNPEKTDSRTAGTNASSTPPPLPVSGMRQNGLASPSAVRKAVNEKPQRLDMVLLDHLNHGLGTTTRLKVAQRPFPPSQMIDIYGPEYVREILFGAYQIASLVPNKGVVHYPDVQSYVQEELSGAYGFLRDAAHSFATGQTRIDLWRFCSPPLVSAIRGRRPMEIDAMRKAFDADVRALGATSKSKVTPALAWAILVDSALLNQQLTQDMTEAAAARGGGFQLQAEWMDYFSPEPSPPARQNFNEYVRCRWPIHVFALDPAADQQNVADTYSSRREMQLAMSLAFVSGNLSANNMFQYARRLEMDMETIALNNTAVGFSHGTETFGWRFYPRFQTPDTDSNLKVFFQDLLCGGPNRKQLLRQRMLEPGIRECVAIVLMPSFVPYADLDAASNWFALDNPHRKLMNSDKAVRLSEQVKGIQNGWQTVCDPNCCLDGEVDRLRRRSQQLASRLPLQSMSVQVPYENTLGGFAMFNTGVTDLAPELLGWYGAPAINLDAPTTVFLIGNHFSVHQTRVLLGGQEITTPELLSRQVMKVTVPANAIALVEDSGEVYGGWKDPLTSASPTEAITLDSVPGPHRRNAITSIDAVPIQSVYTNRSLIFKSAIRLSDPALAGTQNDLTLTANHGTLALGPTDDLCFTAGANGSASLTVKGTPEKLDAAMKGLTYKPNSNFTGTDTLSISLKGSGVNSPCTVSVAITVKPVWPDFLYVDVQLATPYGSTSHLLVPAWHLGKTGSGTLAPPPSPDQAAQASAPQDASVASSKSPAVSQPQWTTTQFALGYVAKGIGINASDPPSFAPNALTINLGPSYQIPSDSTATLQLSLSGSANGTLAPLQITVVQSPPATPGTPPTGNYNPTSHVLTITGSDLTRLSASMFNVIQYQYGATRPIVPPNASFTVDATVAGTGEAPIKLVNQLTINLVAAAAKPATPTAGTATPGAASP